MHMDGRTACISPLCAPKFLQILQEQHMAGPTKGIVPHIVVDNAAAAIDFYVKAFGAKEVSRAPMKDGRIMHAALEINGGTLYLHDDFPEMSDGKTRTPKNLNGISVTLHMNVENCDESFKRAVGAG